MVGAGVSPAFGQSAHTNVRDSWLQCWFRPYSEVEAKLVSPKGVPITKIVPRLDALQSILNSWCLPNDP